MNLCPSVFVCLLETSMKRRKTFKEKMNYPPFLRQQKYRYHFQKLFNSFIRNCITLGSINKCSKLKTCLLAWCSTFWSLSWNALKSLTCTHSTAESGDTTHFNLEVGNMRSDEVEGENVPIASVRIWSQGNTGKHGHPTPRNTLICLKIESLLTTYWNVDSCGPGEGDHCSFINPEQQTEKKIISLSLYFYLPIHPITHYEKVKTLITLLPWTNIDQFFF